MFKQEGIQRVGFPLPLGAFLLQGRLLCLQCFKAIDQIVISAFVLALILSGGGVFSDTAFDHSGDDLHFTRDLIQLFLNAGAVCKRIFQEPSVFQKGCPILNQFADRFPGVASCIFHRP